MVWYFNHFCFLFWHFCTISMPIFYQHIFDVNNYIFQVQAPETLEDNQNAGTYISLQCKHFFNIYFLYLLDFVLKRLCLRFRFLHSHFVLLVTFLLGKIGGFNFSGPWFGTRDEDTDCRIVQLWQRHLVHYCTQQLDQVFNFYF